MDAKSIQMFHEISNDERAADERAFSTNAQNKNVNVNKNKSLRRQYQRKDNRQCERTMNAGTRFAFFI